MKIILSISFWTCLLLSNLQAQKTTVSGYVLDAESGEALIGATVQVKGTASGTITNEYGFYSLSLEPNVYVLNASYIGFTDQEFNVDISSANAKQDFELGLEGTQLEEIVVTAAEEDRNVQEVQMSVERLDMSTIEKMPALLGEVDVIRSIQLLPGVTTVGEGASGFNVRGGSVDQNLVILDEAPVYNSSHLFGFFSVFNPDAVKGVKLYKGGIPARYGGRLSSILDVRMKEGNRRKLNLEGGIGTIFSRLAVEAPIVKDKASFLVAGRRSYIDVLAKPFLKEDVKDNGLYFYDLTLKTNLKAGENDQFFLSGYLGRDVFRFGNDAGFNWGNQTATFRWNHIFNDRLFSNLTAYYSNYDYQLNFGDTDEDSFDWSAKIVNLSAKPEFSYFVSPNNIIRFGGQAIGYEFQPANAVSVNSGETVDISLAKQKAIESGVFVENEVTIKEKLKLNYGIRLSHFAYLGGRNKYTFGTADEPGAEAPLEEAVFVEKGKVIEDWINLEPRFSLQYKLSDASSVKASYNRTTQYIHLLSNTAASIPVDVWTPSTNNINPQLADQVALGYFQNLSDNTYELSAEVYYKKFAQLIDYVDGADLVLNELVEGSIIEGEGRAYGLELMVKKTKGRFSGWVNYSLSRTERLFKGISNGDWYPSRFDQPHNFNVTAFYDLSPRATLSGTFVFNSGTPVTLASSGYYQQGLYIPNNDNNIRNNYRIPNYHRMDVSLTLDPKPENANKRWQGQWVFSVYNLYGRKNAFSIFGQQSSENTSAGQAIGADAIRYSVIGSIIPSVSYNFKFK